MLEYQVPTEDLKLSQVFHKLEMLRKTGSIDDYSVTQTTLDQVSHSLQLLQLLLYLLLLFQKFKGLIFTYVSRFYIFSYVSNFDTKLRIND